MDLYCFLGRIGSKAIQWLVPQVSELSTCRTRDRSSGRQLEGQYTCLSNERFFVPLESGLPPPSMTVAVIDHPGRPTAA